MSDGHPVWMYRKGEAKLFASPADVPEGEGWGDVPIPADPVDDEEPVSDAAPRKRGRPRKVPTDTPDTPDEVPE